MAKKPSSGSKRAKRPVSQSAVKGGGIMSLNKSNTSPFMKFVIILVIVAMVTLFLYGGIAGLIQLFQAPPAAPVVDPVVAIQKKYDPQLQNIDTALASNPASYTLLVAAGNKRFDYALELMQLVSAQSTVALVPAAEQWTATKDVFQRAVEANKSAESGVLVDYSIATYYSGDTTGAVKIASGVIKKDPTFAPAHYNIAIFFEGLGDTARAIAAYQAYLALDPTGKAGGNPDFAKAQLKALGAPEKAPGSVIPTGSTALTGSAPATP
jgi:hypothetical protein